MSIFDLFKPVEPLHHSIMGEKGLETWENNPEHRKANRGMGRCNTGSGRRIICCFGGIGCNVDHMLIAYEKSKHD